VGGYYSSIGGQNRNNLAALDSATGAALAWNPNASAPILAIALNGNTIYVAGQFTSIGGQARNRIAGINASTGLATEWNPNANSEIYSLCVKDNQVFVSGAFSSIGGQSRSRIACIDPLSGLATSWNPNTNGAVNCISLDESTVFAGGNFSTIGGIPRRNFAAISVGSLPLYYRTRQSGNWNDVNSWETSPFADFSSQLRSPASSLPSINAISVKVQSGHTVIVTADVFTANVSVNPTGVIIVNEGINFRIK
jgi:hypothetical protein